MRSLRIANLLVLFLLGVALAVTNVWVSATRSMIPLQIDSQVVEKECRSEKHSGRDDVFLLQLDPDGVLQVDQAVYEAVQPGEQISKTTWSRQLQTGTEFLDLQWSKDFYGMINAMPLILAVAFITSIWAYFTKCD